jgi:hypothetical protein
VIDRLVSGLLGLRRHAGVLAHDGTVTRGGRPLDVDRHGHPVDEDTVVVITGGTL